MQDLSREFPQPPLASLESSLDRVCQVSFHQCLAAINIVVQKSARWRRKHDQLTEGEVTGLGRSLYYHPFYSELQLFKYRVYISLRHFTLSSNI